MLGDQRLCGHGSIVVPRSLFANPEEDWMCSVASIKESGVFV